VLLLLPLATAAVAAQHMGFWAFARHLGLCRRRHGMMRSAQAASLFVAPCTTSCWSEAG